MRASYAPDVQVGELGVLRFGGSGAVAPLHALGRPFTDADGPRVLSEMRFAQVRCAHLSSLCGQREHA